MRPPYCVVQIFPLDWRVSLTTELKQARVQRLPLVATGRREETFNIIKFASHSPSVEERIMLGIISFLSVSTVFPCLK